MFGGFSTESTRNRLPRSSRSHLPLDLRDAFCPVGSVASTALHHVGITLWRSEDGFEHFRSSYASGGYNTPTRDTPDSRARPS